MRLKFASIIIFQEEGYGHWSMSETDFSVSRYRKHSEKNSWRSRGYLSKETSTDEISSNNVHKQANQSYAMESQKQS